MKEKERYELIGYCSYRDTETGVISDNFVGLLNQQDKEIMKLREENQQLKQTQKQLAISELKRLKENFDYCPYSEDKIYLGEVCEIIDNQINELKGRS